MTLTTTQVCDLYSWLYTDTVPVPEGTWDHILPTDGSYVAVKRIDGVDYVCFRGSVTALDWLEDATALPSTTTDPLLGEVHPGFSLGVQKVRDQLDKLIGPEVVVVGHSLGAGHAALYSGDRVATGNPVEKILLFGCPRPGGDKLKEILSKTPITSYRCRDANGHDLVTNVPLGLGYRHVAPFTELMVTPMKDDPWLAFKYHHFGLYCRALNATGQASVSLPGFKK